MSSEPRQNPQRDTADESGEYAVGLRCHRTFYGARMAATAQGLAVYKDRKRIWAAAELRKLWRKRS